MLDFIKNNGNRKTNVAETSLEAYRIIKSEGQITRETDLVLKIIAEQQPITSRRIAYLTKKERSNITRSLFNLVDAEKVKYPFTDKCPVTNKRVRYYTLIDWKG